MNWSAVILAGGKSSRMGRDKAWLELDGQTLLARQIRIARESGATEVFISGRPEVDYSASGSRVLLDQFPDAGPLAGIESALAVITTPLVLVLAVDMPALRVEWLRKLQSGCEENCGVIPRVNGRIEPLAGFYPKAAHALAVTLLRRGNSGAESRAPGPTDFARECVAQGWARFVEVSGADAGLFRNLNAPEDVPG